MYNATTENTFLTLKYCLTEEIYVYTYIHFLYMYMPSIFCMKHQTLYLIVSKII